MQCCCRWHTSDSNTHLFKCYSQSDVSSSSEALIRTHTDYWGWIYSTGTQCVYMAHKQQKPFKQRQELPSESNRTPSNFSCVSSCASFISLTVRCGCGAVTVRRGARHRRVRASCAHRAPLNKTKSPQEPQSCRKVTERTHNAHITSYLTEGLVMGIKLHARTLNRTLE